MSNNPEYRIGVGAPSILMIFVILILTTLGVLSFASAKSDLTLTEKRLAQVSAYYESNAEAEALLSQIDAALLDAQADPDAFDDRVWALTDLDDSIEIDDTRLTYRVPVRETQELVIELDILPPGEPTRYTIASWYLVNIEEWEPDAFFDLSY